MSLKRWQILNSMLSISFSVDQVMSRLLILRYSKNDCFCYRLCFFIYLDALQYISYNYIFNSFLDNIQPRFLVVFPYFDRLFPFFAICKKKYKNSVQW